VLRISIGSPQSQAEQKNHSQIIALVKQQFPSAFGRERGTENGFIETHGAFALFGGHYCMLDRVTHGYRNDSAFCEEARAYGNRHGDFPRSRLCHRRDEIEMSRSGSKGSKRASTQSLNSHSLSTVQRELAYIASSCLGSNAYAFSVSPDAESVFLAALTRQNARNIPAAERTQNTGSAIFAAGIVSRNARPQALQHNSNTKKPMHGSATNETSLLPRPARLIAYSKYRIEAKQTDPNIQ
jgi:hypothetical protein